MCLEKELEKICQGPLAQFPTERPLKKLRSRNSKSRNGKIHSHVAFWHTTMERGKESGLFWIGYRSPPRCMIVSQKIPFSSAWGAERVEYNTFLPFSGSPVLPTRVGKNQSPWIWLYYKVRTRPANSHSVQWWLEFFYDTNAESKWSSQLLRFSSENTMWQSEFEERKL